MQTKYLNSKTFLHRQPVCSDNYNCKLIANVVGDCEDLGCEQLCVLEPLTGARCLCGEGYVPENNPSTSCKRRFNSFVCVSNLLFVFQIFCLFFKSFYFCLKYFSLWFKFCCFCQFLFVVLLLFAFQMYLFVFQSC
jgi:hypothetical protein